MNRSRVVASVAYALTKNEYTNFIVETAEVRAAQEAENYLCAVNCGDYLGAHMCLLSLKEQHRNFMAAHKALTALAKVAVDMGLENDILPDAPPPEAE